MIVQEINTRKPWEEYITLGMEARSSKDASQWRLGDLASEISKEYGQDSLGKYAYAISVEKKTLQNYRTIAQKFVPKIRGKYRKLSFSHFASVAASKHPEQWLEQADTNEWSVETLRTKEGILRKALKPPVLSEALPKVVKCEKCGLWRLEALSTYDICKGHYDYHNGEMVYS